MCCSGRGSPVDFESRFESQGDAVLSGACHASIARAHTAAGRAQQGRTEALLALAVPIELAPLLHVFAGAALTEALLALDEAHPARLAATEAAQVLGRLAGVGDGSIRLRLFHALASDATGQPDRGRRVLSDARIIIDARLAELRSVDGDTLTRPFEA